MAVITLHESGRRIVGDDAVHAFLGEHGLDHGRWDIRAIPAAVLARNTLTPDEKQQVLDALRERIEAEQARAGYRFADVVALSPETPGLDQILEPFRRAHFHTENEIRFVVDGRGVFSIDPRTAPAFDVAMDPGDFISIPAGTWHWFNLGEERRIKAVRIFESTEGWEAIYVDAAGAREDSHDPSPSAAGGA